MRQIIRKMRAEDIVAVNKLYGKLAIDQTTQNSYYANSTFSLDLKDYYKNCLKDGKCGVFVAKLGDEIVGFIEVWQRTQDDNFEVAPFAYIQHLFVDEPARKTESAYKILAELFEAAENWAIEKGYAFLGADTYSFNDRVQVLAKSLGFSPYKIRFIKKLMLNEE